MTPQITTIRLALPYRLGSVNCYLVTTEGGCLLIDTGSSHRRAELEAALARAGCTSGRLQLILLTHGDFDHTGNAVHLLRKFGTKIAMHQADAGMAERADMFSNRKPPRGLLRWIGPLVPRLAGFGQAERFVPDVTLEDGDDLSAYGLDARVISLPGHSQGSIGVLTAAGDLFCGDLLNNRDGPVLTNTLDDRAAGRASLEKLKGLAIRTVYPGHGAPFSWEQLAL